MQPLCKWEVSEFFLRAGFSIGLQITCFDKGDGLQHRKPICSHGFKLMYDHKVFKLPNEQLFDLLLVRIRLSLKQTRAQ